MTQGSQAKGTLKIKVGNNEVEWSGRLISDCEGPYIQCFK